VFVLEYGLECGAACIDSFAVFVGSFVEAGDIVPGWHGHSHVHGDWLGWCSGEDEF